MTVCDVIGGNVYTNEQDPMFHGRVEFFPSEFSKGNFSIKLHNVNLSYKGIYTCNFPYTLTPEKVQLEVTGVYGY